MRWVGSSPLSRGIPADPASGPCPCRIIPALAGNTVPQRFILWKDGDHPRSRGEYDPPARMLRRRSGSSPLSRGILVVLGLQRQQRRIIPALAGNTRSYVACCRRTGDHPRSRGEYEFNQVWRNAMTGSSPLSRGIQPRGRGATTFPRIIPALAGNTFAGVRRRGWGGDHPRSRGEYW